MRTCSRSAEGRLTCIPMASPLRVEDARRGVGVVPLLKSECRLQQGTTQPQGED